MCAQYMVIGIVDIMGLTCELTFEPCRLKGFLGCVLGGEGGWGGRAMLALWVDKKSTGLLSGKIGGEDGGWGCREYSFVYKYRQIPGLGLLLLDLCLQCGHSSLSHLGLCFCMLLLPGSCCSMSL